MKFIADSMLGRLAKWLRLLGYDTLYYPHIQDSLLLRIAKEQNRIILTRDTRLVKVRDIGEHLLLADNDPFIQLQRLINTYDMLSQITDKGKIVLPAAARCSICNEPLRNISADRAHPHVPEYIYETAGSFKHCPQCRKFYWRGSHQDNLKKKLEELFNHT